MVLTYLHFRILKISHWSRECIKKWVTGSYPSHNGWWLWVPQTDFGNPHFWIYFSYHMIFRTDTSQELNSTSDFVNQKDVDPWGSRFQKWSMVFAHRSADVCSYFWQKIPYGYHGYWTDCDLEHQKRWFAVRLFTLCSITNINDYWPYVFLNSKFSYILNS